MRIIVTGAAGFIGSHLVEALINLGHDVSGIDNLETGRNENLRCANKQWDISSHPLPPATQDIDWVFHLAGLADIVPSVERPHRYHEVNTHGTFRMLEWARRSGVRRFIYAASGSCYGIPEFTPTPETADIRPAYPYALTKRLGEEYVLHYAKVYGMGACSLRLANVYGPRSRTSGTYGAVFGTFMAQIANNAPVTIVGNGTQRRDFIYVSDVVRAFIAAAESDVSGEAFNVGSDYAHSINDLARLLGSETQTRIPERPAEPRSTLLDITKINRALGWYPAVSFAEGVAVMRKLIPSFKGAPLWTPELIAEATRAWHEHLGGNA